MQLFYIFSMALNTATWIVQSIFYTPILFVSRDIDLLEDRV